MGADMLVATITVPRTRKVLDFANGHLAVESCEQRDFEDFVEIIMAGEDDDLTTCQQAAHAAIDSLASALGSRETICIQVADYDVYLSGGLSWGDSPTDAAEAIWNAQSLPKSVRRAMGVVLDPTAPLDTGDPSAENVRE